MKRLMIIALVLGCAGIHAAESFDAAPENDIDTAQPVTQDSAGFLAQLRQALGAKAVEDGAQEVRPVVDASFASDQDDGDADFDFEENAGIDLADDLAEDQQEELSGEEMSGYFADVINDDAEGIGS